MRNADVVRRFENEFKNRSNFAVVDELIPKTSSTTSLTRASPADAPA